jgi:hypothetical protein
VSVFLERPGGRVVLIYALAIYGFPFALLGVLVWLTRSMLG